MFILNRDMHQKRARALNCLFQKNVKEKLKEIDTLHIATITCRLSLFQERHVNSAQLILFETSVGTGLALVRADL